MWASGIDIGTNTNPSFSPAHEADLVAAFLNSAGVALNPWGSTFDLLYNDVADHNAGWWEIVAKDGGAHWWDRQNLKLPNFTAWLTWMTELHKQTNRPLTVWQVPVGNQYFLTVNNTDGHYQDNRAEYFLSHVPDLQAAGITTVLFDSGYTDAKRDGITNNNGVPTSDLAGGCNACNTHVSVYADDDGGYLRIFVGQFYVHRPFNRQMAPTVGGSAWHPRQPVPPAVPQSAPRSRPLLPASQPASIRLVAASTMLRIVARLRSAF